MRATVNTWTWPVEQHEGTHTVWTSGNRPCCGRSSSCQGYDVRLSACRSSPPWKTQTSQLYRTPSVLEDMSKKECLKKKKKRFSQSFGPQIVNKWQLADVDELHLRTGRKKQSKNKTWLCAQAAVTLTTTWRRRCFSYTVSTCICHLRCLPLMSAHNRPLAMVTHTSGVSICFRYEIALMTRHFPVSP